MTYRPEYWRVYSKLERTKRLRSRQKRRYRKSHRPEICAKAREYNRRYYLAHREQILEKNRKWSRDNRGRATEEMRRFRARQRYINNLAEGRTEKWGKNENIEGLGRGGRR